jgi:hypothetical protein
MKDPFLQQQQHRCAAAHIRRAITTHHKKNIIFNKLVNYNHENTTITQRENFMIHIPIKRLKKYKMSTIPNASCHQFAAYC